VNHRPGLDALDRLDLDRRLRFGEPDDGAEADRAGAVEQPYALTDADAANPRVLHLALAQDHRVPGLYGFGAEERG